jgi:hypothetical protein
MRPDPDDDDGKKPSPVTLRKKGTNATEASEAGEPLRKDNDRDHRRHVC